MAADFLDHASTSWAAARLAANASMSARRDISVAQSSIAIGQFRIEAAQRQAADDLLLEQRLVDRLGRLPSHLTTNSLKNGPLKRGFSLPAR